MKVIDSQKNVDLWDKFFFCTSEYPQNKSDYDPFIFGKAEDDHQTKIDDPVPKNNDLLVSGDLSAKSDSFIVSDYLSMKMDDLYALEVLNSSSSKS